MYLLILSNSASSLTVVCFVFVRLLEVLDDTVEAEAAFLVLVSVGSSSIFIKREERKW